MARGHFGPQTSAYAQSGEPAQRRQAVIDAMRAQQAQAAADSRFYDVARGGGGGGAMAQGARGAGGGQFQPGGADGSRVAGFSQPFYGDKALYKDPAHWLVPFKGPAEDLNAMFSPSYAQWQEYAPSDPRMNPELMAALQARAMGEGPSEAEELARRQAIDQRRDLMRAFQSQRGVNPLLAAKMGAEAGMDVMAQSRDELAALRAREQQQAMDQWLQGEQSAGDLALGSEQMRAQQRLKAADVAMHDAEAERKAKGGILEGVGTVIGAIASDETLKENIEDGDQAIEELMGALSPKSFTYKSEEYGKGDFLGFMAQDAEKSEAGKAMVVEKDGKKMIDSKRALMLALAGNANLHKRLGELEDARG